MAKKAAAKKPAAARTSRPPAALTSKLAAEIRHLDGCPAGRTEEYEATRPDGEKVVVARCIDCGASTVD